MRQSATEVAAKAAAQVNEINAKVAVVATSTTTIPTNAAETVTPHNNESSAPDLAVSPQTATPTASKEATAAAFSSPSSASLTKSPHDETTTTTPTAAAAATEKKELLELLQKMNKKVKALTMIRQQLTDQVESVSAEKRSLETLVAEEILNGVSVQLDQAIVPQLQAAWRQQDEQNSLALQQLQKEFQILQQQQQSQPPHKNGDSANWEAEKQELVQKHETQLALLQEEMAAAVAPAQESKNMTPSVAPAVDNNSEVQRIKEAAAAQLQEFKKKVAVARNAEIAKVKADAGEAAKTILEVKLTEQKEAFQKQLADASQLNAAALSALSSQVASLHSQLESSRLETEASHAKEMERVSLETAQTIEGLRQQHATATQQLQSERQSMQATIAKEAQIEVESLRKEKDTVKAAMETAVAALQSQLAASQAAVLELQKNATKVESNATTELIAAKDVEIANLKLEARTAQEIQRNELLEKFANEKEEVRLDFQEKWKDATAKNQAAAATQLQNAVQQVTMEHAEKMDQMQKDWETSKNVETANARGELESAVQQAVKVGESKLAFKEKEIQSQLDKAIEELTGQLTERNVQVQTLQTREQSLQVELNEVKALLASFRDGSDSSTKAMDEALATQRSSYEAIIETQKKQHDLAFQTTASDIESLQLSRDEALFNIIDLQNEREKDKSMNEESIKTAENLTKELASLESKNSSLEVSLLELSKRSSDSLLASEKQLEEMRLSAKCKDEVTLAEHTELVEGLRTAYTISEVAREKADSTLVSVQRELLDAKKVIENSGESAVEHWEKEFESRLKTVEEKNNAEREKLQRDHEAMIQTIRENVNVANVELVTRLEEEKINLSAQLDAANQSLNDEKSTMRKAMETHVDKMTSQFKEKMEALRTKATEETSAMQASVDDKDAKMMQLLERLKALTASSTKLRDENNQVKLKLDAEVNTQKDIRSQLTAMKKQLDDTVANSSSTVSSLLKQQELIEKEKTALENDKKMLQVDLQSKTNKVEELSGKLQALSGNLNALTQDQKFKDGQLEQASKQEAKLQASEAEVTELRGQINKLKLEMTRNSALVEKLQAEKEANERNHGQRTALVGLLETQLSDMNDKLADVNAKLEASLYDLSQKAEEIQIDNEKINKLEQELVEAKRATTRTAESLAAAQKGADTKSSKQVELLQKELQTTKQQMARKSAAAQQLLQQRESECAELRKTNKVLQHEVDKGSFSDRRIFELAAKQSDRESFQVSEINVRDNIIDRLKEALLDRDGDLASAEKHAHEVESQIEELFRIRRREDINIDYLKSIVVQYLSLPSGSTERAQLLPVLATLLQFDEGDYKTIQEGKSKVSWWDGSVIPKLIFPPGASSSGTPIPATSGSAEVSVTSTATSASGKRTSLEF